MEEKNEDLDVTINIERASSNKRYLKLILIAIISFATVTGIFYIIISIFLPSKNIPQEITKNEPLISPENTPIPVEAKELLAESKSNIVYLTDITEIDKDNKVGKILVYNKNKKSSTRMKDNFTYQGEPIVIIEDKEGNYLIVSPGTYTSRNMIVYDLTSKKQVAKPFCATPKMFFWESYLIYNNCDTFQNRPWGTGEAPSIVMLNLKTDLEKILFKSDLFKHFSVDSIGDRELLYKETSVANEQDWKDIAKQEFIVKKYNLSPFNN